MDEYFQSTARSWRDVYHRDDLSGHIHRDRQSAALTMVEKLRLSQQARVLDVGCGTGVTTVMLAKRGYRVVAIDTVESMLGLARQHAAEVGVDDRIEFSRADIHEMNFASDEFDLALAIGLIPWLDHPQQAIHRMVQVVRPRGHLLLSMDNQWCLNHILDPRCFPALRPVRWRLADLLNRLATSHASRHRYRYYSIFRFDAILSHAGLEKLESTTVGFGPFTFCNIRLLQDSLGTRVHQKLQSLAQMQFPVIRSTGTEYVVLTRKL